MTRRSNPDRTKTGRLVAVLAVITLSACTLDPLGSVTPNLSVDGNARPPIVTDPQCEQNVSNVLTDLCWVSHGGDASVIVDPITFGTYCTCTYGDQP